jgi:hypothetical protein
MNKLFREPNGSERRFIAAVGELCWSAAIANLPDDVSMAEAAHCPRMAEALVQMFIDAPGELLPAARARLTGENPDHGPKGLALRNSLVERLAVACIDVACARLKDGNPAHSAHYLSAAIRLLPARTVRQERQLEEAFKCFATATGDAEATFASEYPELEDDPLHDHNLMAGLEPGSEICRNHDPHLLPELIRLAAEKGASDELIVAALRDLFSRAHWPSWRAAARFRGELLEHFQTLETRGDEGGFLLMPSACFHLHAIVDGWDIHMPDFGGDVSF